MAHPEGSLSSIVEDDGLTCLHKILCPLAARGPKRAPAEEIRIDNMDQFIAEQLSSIDAEYASRQAAPAPGTPLATTSAVVGEFKHGGPMQEVEATSPFTTLLVQEPVTRGRWMYEVVLGTAGVMQIGWAAVAPFNIEMGIGDFPDTYAYDGKRLQKWSVHSAPYGLPWAAGDVIGSCIDLDAGEISYYRNGVPLGVAFVGVRPGLEYRAGLSLSERERVFVNAGALPFAHAVAGYAALQCPPPPAALASAALLAGCLRRLLLHSRGCPACALSQDDVAIAAAQLLDRLSPLLVSSPYAVAAQLCPLLAELPGEAAQRLLELFEAVLGEAEFVGVAQAALAMCAAVSKATSPEALLGPGDRQQPAPAASAPLTPLSALDCAAALVASPSCRPLLQGEYGFQLVENLLATKVPTAVDRRELMPVVWWNSAAHPEPEENRAKAREAARLLEAAYCQQERAQLLVRNKDYSKSVRPLGLSDPAFLVNVFFVLLRFLSDHLSSSDPAQWCHAILYGTTALSDVPRLGGDFGFLLKELTPPEGLRDPAAAREEDRLADLLARLFVISVGLQLQAVVSDFQATSALLRSLEEVGAQGHLQIPAYERIVANARAELSEVVRRSMWNQVRLFSQEKLRMMVSAVDYFCRLLFELGAHDPALSYVPQCYTDMIFDSFHTFRRFELPILELPCSQSFAVFTARYISDGRIKNPDTKDVFLQSTFSLLSNPRFVKLFEGSPEARRGLIPGLVELFGARYWIEVARILLCFWAGDLFCSRAEEEGPRVLRSELGSYLGGRPEALSQFVSQVLNNLNATMSELFAAFSEIANAAAGRRAQEMAQAKNRVLMMFDLSVILLRLLEALAKDLRAPVLGNEILRIKLAELVVFALNRCTVGQDARFITAASAHLQGDLELNDVLAPLAGVLADGFADLEDPLARCACEQLSRTPGFAPETVEFLAAKEWPRSEPAAAAVAARLAALGEHLRQLQAAARATPEPTEEEEEALCEICCAVPKDTVLLPCRHVSCHVCIQRQLEHERTCFFCKQPVESTAPYTPTPTPQSPQPPAPAAQPQARPGATSPPGRQ
eukprot:m51a1_g14082 hypothetical protein (1074) ;mRNA; r:2004-6570